VIRVRTEGNCSGNGGFTSRPDAVEVGGSQCI
jgi:hypothetical protein